jgi:hypothetical protein
MTKPKHPQIFCWTIAAGAMLQMGCAIAAPTTPAEFTITTNTLNPQRPVMPIGVNNFGDSGGLNLSANTLFKGGGFEPVSIRRTYRVTKAGDNWVEVDRGGAGGYALWGSGLFSGARARIYRLVDKDGNVLPPKSATDPYFNVSLANRVELVRDTTIIPKGSAGFPKGGFIVSNYSSLKNPVTNAPAAVDSKTFTYTDSFSLSPTEPAYYVVRAVDNAGNTSGWSNEVSGTPARGIAPTPTLKFAVPKAESNGDKTAPEPPSNLKAVAGAGSITLSWDASPATDVSHYEIFRAEAPLDQQVQRMYFSGQGPALAVNDYIFLEAERTEFPNEDFNVRVRPRNDDDMRWPWTSEGGKVSFSLVKHPAPVPTEWKDGGQTALLVEADAGPKKLTQIFGVGTNQEKEARWWGQLEAGKNYRMEVWLCQQDLADNGTVEFGFSGRDAKFTALKKQFNISDQWQKVNFDFTAPDFPKTTPHFGWQFRFTGPGKLWMDNLRIFRYDSEADLNKPYVPNRTYLNTLLAAQPTTGPKAALRAYGPMFNEGSMKSQFGYFPQSRLSFSWYPQINSNNNMTLAHSLEFMYQTGDSPETRMRPWLTWQIYYNEKEWQDLAEYLGAPYDPAKDTPQTKPYAYERFIQRGHGRPWSDDFAEIIFEFGNETWHNGAMANWDGFDRFKSIRPGAPDWGPEYGFFTQYFFSQITKSPYWKSSGLDRKVRFNMGGFYDGRIRPDGVITGYAETAIQHAPLVTQIGHANYVGPKWETGEKALTEFNNDGLFRMLLGWVNGSSAADLRAGQVAVQKKLAERGINYDLTAYEGGPSGFMVPGSKGATPEVVAVTQLYGKSKAAGVAALDAWLDCSRLGYTYQNYLVYGQGINWNSHTALWEGFRPTPGWLYMMMRNRHASGGMVEVEKVSAPTAPVGQKELPLVGAYAFRDGSKYAVFVLSRKVKGQAVGTDFAEGFTPVKLNLPFSQAAKVTQYYLTGEAGDSNLNEEKVKFESREIPANSIAANKTFTIDAKTGGGTGGLPAGTAFLYVFEGTQ